MLDRVPTKPGRVLITPEGGGSPYYAVVTRADDPVQEGTPLNKGSLLTDAVAGLFGLSATATPNDVLNAVKTQLNGKAPTNHRSTGSSYGAATSSYYGHVKLSDSTDSTSGAASGVAATPAAVKAAIAASQPYAYPISGCTPVPLGERVYYPLNKEIIFVPGGLIIRVPSSFGDAGWVYLDAPASKGGKLLLIAPGYAEQVFDNNNIQLDPYSDLGNGLLYRINIRSTFTEWRFIPCVAYTKN